MTRVLVTGGCGFLGGHLVEHLASTGQEVTVFDAAPPPPGAPGSVRYVQGDIRDENALARAVDGRDDVIYHLSAVVGVDQYLSRPADVVEINLLGTLNVLRQARENGNRVIVASTSEVYGKNPDPPWHEDADRVLGSTSVDRWSYSTSKALADHLTFGYIRQYGVNATILRYFNVYGPRQRAAYVVSRSVHRALRGISPELYDGGSQTRCFTYVDDAIRGTVTAANSPKAEGECFNIGSDRETTVAEVIQTICELTGVSVPDAPFDTASRLGSRYQDIGRRVPDVRKARDVLGVTCGTSLREGLRRTIEWARQDPAWLAATAG
ncbi:NAD-dependent epimerase/dehydratase family protein [Actinomadura sp. DC4]|uniref:NAD-dependent epimerase/dehydratase family protein n=1 Tax=Actinomadura sp. DC4 TaxID=3055069 RepID=UPI0025B1CE33|nr:NAD-dependent epimerase/dehydratase family protein [Actinomadura sp. DC4]MDN3354719.1 NAD-dependent epimerase/dehydratase family protein [Actinomadura sp. DC4]